VAGSIQNGKQKDADHPRWIGEKYFQTIPLEATFLLMCAPPRNRMSESILQAYVAWRADTTNRVVVPARQAGNRFLGLLKIYKYGLWLAGTPTLFLLGSSLHRLSKIPP
jgi:hypothetical protein